MNIYTVTYFEDNYGSILQAYSLQTVLKSYGAEPYILKKKSIEHPSKIRHFFGTIKRLLKPQKNYSLKKRIDLLCEEKKYAVRKQKMNEFIRNNMTVHVYDENQDSQFRQQDVFLAGSDQLWNVTDGPISNWFTFKWLDPRYKRYSYAVSLGTNELSNEQIISIKDALAEFQKVSVREKQSLNLLSPILGDKVRQDLDPVLLHNHDFWRNKQSQRLINEPYIFVYRLRPNEDIMELAKRVSKEKKCRIVYTGLYSYEHDGVTNIYDAGIDDFLSLIENAEVVITNSFHGTAFSVLLEKPFLSVKIATTGLRAESLLGLLNLQSQLLEDVNADYNLEIDYPRVSKTLDELRISSLEYLKSICHGEYNN